MYEDFFEPDAGEIHLDKMVAELDAEELLKYSMAMFADTMGYKYKSDWIKERAILKWLQKTYSKRDAGLVVKWMFYKYGGTFDGETFTVSWFCSPRKWWIDQRRAEVMVVVAQRNGTRKKSKIGNMNRIEALSGSAPGQEVYQG